MIKKAIYEKVKTYISKGEIEKALTEIITELENLDSEKFPQKSTYHDELIMLSAKNNQLRGGRLSGMISLVESSLESSKIVGSLLTLLDELQGELKRVKKIKKIKKKSKKIKKHKLIEIVIDRDFETYSGTELDSLLKSMHELLESKKEIKVINKEKGSVRIELELDDDEQAERLYWLIKSGSLLEHGVENAKLKSFLLSDENSVKNLNKNKKKSNQTQNDLLADSNLLKEVKLLLRQGELENALRELDKFFEKRDKRACNQIIVHQSTLSTITRSTNLGLEERKQNQQIRNNITYSVLELIDDYEEKTTANKD